MKILPYLGLILSAALAAPLVHAAPASIIEQGTGWQRIAPPSDGATARSFPGRPGVRTSQEVVFVASRAGVEGAPISEAAKQLLRAEFDEAAAATASSGASGEVPADADALIFDPLLLDAVAAGTEGTLYADFIEADPDGEAASQPGTKGWGCATHWRNASNTIFDQGISEVAGRVDRDGRADFTGQLSFTGHVKVDALWQWKKSRICVPYIARYRGTGIVGDITVDNTSVAISHELQATPINIRRELGEIFNRPYTIWVGPVPVVLGARAPYGWGAKLVTAITSTVSVAMPISGTKRFDYICTVRDGCLSNLNPNHPENNTLEYDGITSTTAGFGVTVDALLKPFAYVELMGYLYDPLVSHVAIGVELSAPVRLWATAGKTCGSSRPGSPDDTVVGGFVDINAELGLYWKYNLAGLDGAFGMNWDRGIYLLNRWKVVHVDDLLRGGPTPLAVLRKHLYFKRVLENPAVGKSPFSPVFEGDGTASVHAPEEMTFRLRNCLPIKDAVTFRAAFGDGTGTDVHETENEETGQRSDFARAQHSYGALGQFTASAYPKTDTAGRDYSNGGNPQNPVTARSINVESHTNPPKPTITSFSNTASLLQLGWNKTVNTTTYKIYLQTNGGVWLYKHSVSQPTSGQPRTNLSVPVGVHRMGVIACNYHDGDERCSDTAMSASIQIGTPPVAPANVSSQHQSCNGWNTISWSAVTGATSYQLYKNTLNDPSQATQVFSGNVLTRQVDAPERTYFWVKACNAAACSVFSPSTRTIVYPGCS